ncbi:hypothetical protein [Thermovibrio sp.]
MRLYLGYPYCVGREGKFKLKDNFLREIGIDYSSVPVEVKKKLLSLLDNLEKRDYLFIKEVFYDAIDIVEFALFTVEVREYSELLLPGYLYGKPTYLIRNLIRETFGKRVSVYYDFNLFKEDSLVINVGYTKTSISVGSKLLTVIPLGEFHFIDLFGNYLFNRLIGETGTSNARLRKEGIRGEILDRCRAQGARILFKRSKELKVEELNYSREVSQKEVEFALSPVVGKSSYGDLIEKPFDFSSSVVYSLYKFEELFKERAKIREVVLIGRLTEYLETRLREILPVRVLKIDETELVKEEVKNRNFKVKLIRSEFSKGRRETAPDKGEKVEGDLKELRFYFNKKDLRGLSVIESLTERGKEVKEFIYELISLLKRSSYKDEREIKYINHSIAALTKIEVPEELFKKVLKELERHAFNWRLPIEVQMNLLFFCYRNRKKVKGSSLEVFPSLLLSKVRDLKLTEGEKNFIRTACQEFYRS